MSFAIALCVPPTARGQAPSSIQFFMPDGSLPPHELRLKVTSEDGKVVDTFFTDSKGRFLLTRSQGLRNEVGYTITVETDGRSYDTTIISFKLYSVSYIPVFLRPLEPKPKTSNAEIDLAEFDASTSAEARQAYAAAMQVLREGKVEEATAGLKKALAIDPAYFRACNDLGVLYMKTGNLEAASSALERAIKIAPKVGYARLNLALVRTRQNRFGEAVELLQALLHDNGSRTEVRIALGDALMGMNRLEEAEKHLRAALTDQTLDRPSAGDVRYKLGLLLNRKQKFAEAVRELMQAAEILPGSARIHLQLGGAQLQLNRASEAETELLEAYRLGGAEMGGAQLLLGQIYFTQKKYVLALRAFEQYVTDVPDAPNAAEVRGVIDKIKAALKP